MLENAAGTIFLTVVSLIVAVIIFRGTSYHKVLPPIFLIAAIMVIVTLVMVVLKVYQICLVKFLSALLFLGGASWLIIRIRTILRENRQDPRSGWIDASR